MGFKFCSNTMLVLPCNMWLKLKMKVCRNISGLGLRHIWWLFVLWVVCSAACHCGLLYNVFIGYSRAAHSGQVLCGAYHGGLRHGALCSLSGCQCCLCSHVKSLQLWWMGKLPLTPLLQILFVAWVTQNVSFPLLCSVQTPTLQYYMGYTADSLIPVMQHIAKNVVKVNEGLSKHLVSWGLNQVYSNICDQLLGLWWTWLVSSFDRRLRTSTPVRSRWGSHPSLSLNPQWSRSLQSMSPSELGNGL